VRITILVDAVRVTDLPVAWKPSGILVVAVVATAGDGPMPITVCVWVVVACRSRHWRLGFPGVTV